MDIDKEREAFVRKYREIYRVDKSLFVNDAGEFYDAFCQEAWLMWQAAKAQVVPEGYVVVHKEPLLKMIESASMLYPVKNIVEAQEPAKDQP